MKGKTNNPNGRPPMDKNKRKKMVSFRINPILVDKLKHAAKDLGCSQSELVEEWLMERLG